MAASDLFGNAGLCQLAGARLAPVYRLRVDSRLELIDGYDDHVERLRRVIAARLGGDRGYRAIQAIPGVGETLAAVLVAKIGDVTGFGNAAAVSSWAGLTPRPHESDTVVGRGSITKQGSRLVRWAAVEAVQRLPFGTKLRADRDRIAARRGNSVARVAAARRLLTLVFYGMRDGEIPSLSATAA